MIAKSCRFVALALILAFHAAATEGRARADFAFSDFGFASGSPFGGATSLGGVDVTLVTTNTEPTQATSFRDLAANTDPASVTFIFSAPITAFALDISFVHPRDEFLTEFDIGLPDTLTGDLINLGGEITTSRSDDFGSGRLIWTGLSTSVVSFTIGNDPASTIFPALAVDRFGINAAVPGPASLILTALGSGSTAFLGLVTARRRGNS